MRKKGAKEKERRTSGASNPGIQQAKEKELKKGIQNEKDKSPETKGSQEYQKVNFTVTWNLWLYCQLELVKGSTQKKMVNE